MRRTQTPWEGFVIRIRAGSVSRAGGRAFLFVMCDRIVNVVRYPSIFFD